jgi:hypothetical protein
MMLKLRDALVHVYQTLGIAFTTETLRLSA